MQKVLVTDDIFNDNPTMERVVSREMVDIMFANNRHTVESLSPQWRENTLKNVKLYRKHGAFRDSFERFGINKAVVGIGAGPSFNLNKKALREMYAWNLQFPVLEQPFIFIATNKIFKSCLELGIQPHMVMLVDAGDVLYPQLCQGIPGKAKGTILVTGLHASHKILRKWDKQGGHIAFYCIGDEEDSKEIRKKIGDDWDRIHIEQGGNVMNTMWMLANHILGSSVFIAVGNDLAFKYSRDYADRAGSFYADGDYRLSILNKRDDAQDKMAWMGFCNMTQSNIQPERTLCDFQVMGTSRLLWIYKTWIEVQVGLWAAKKSFHYYNCSESGILGVLARESSGPALGEKDNWYLMDELFPKRWHTRTLKQAATEFINARSMLCQDQAGILSDVRYAKSPLQGKTGIARDVVLPQQSRAFH